MHNFSIHHAVARVVLCVSFCLGGIGQVWAHAQPETQSPVAGAIVNAASAPQEVQITFNETLEPAFSSIVVSDAQGKP
ncbi:copper resistance CopC family protein, partial [Glaciimonas sp. GG7]